MDKKRIPPFLAVATILCSGCRFSGEDGSGAPVADKPLFVDPVHDGAADPAVIWNRGTKSWFMLYTNRRASATNLTGVEWVHGTHIGLAESTDNGASWRHIGKIRTNIGFNPVEEQTFWAPGVIEHDGIYHLYLTYVPGIFTDWNHPRDILHLTSENLVDWSFQSTLELASDRVIDAAVIRMPGGNWRMWYNNERDNKAIYFADSDDLYNWHDRDRATADQPGEGPVVFQWHDYFWMIVDVWDGLGVYRSPDAAKWIRIPGNLLQEAGSGPQDTAQGQHPDVVVSDDRAYLFYFVHPGETPDASRGNPHADRRSVIQVVELEYRNGRLYCSRDEPARIRLVPPVE